MVDFRKFNQDYADYYHGDESKLAGIYAELPDVLTTLYIKRVGSAAETLARDAAIGGALIKMIPKIKDRAVPLEKEEHSLSNYLNRVLMNKMNDYYRKQKRESTKFEGYVERVSKSAENPIDEIISLEGNDLLHAEIEKLPETQKIAFKEYHFPYENGWDRKPSFDDIADKLDIPASTLRVAAKKARETLVEKMQMAGLLEAPQRAK